MRHRFLLLTLGGLLAGFVLAPVAVAGSPTFKRTDIPVGGAPFGLVSADLDGVHGPDLIMNLGDKIGVLLAKGDGTFSPLALHDGCTDGVDVHAWI